MANIATVGKGHFQLPNQAEINIFEKKNPQSSVSHSSKFSKRNYLHLPSPFAKTGNLFWPDFPRFRFFVWVRTGRTGLNE